MVDTPSAAAAPPSAIEVATQLTAARKIGGPAFRQEAQRLQAAGAQLPPADRQLLTAINASLARGATSGLTADELALGGGLSAADARNQVIGDRLLGAGRTLDEVREIVGDPDFVADGRSEAQRQHDRAYGFVPVVDERAYFARPPADVNLPPVAANALDGDARELAASIGLSPAAGSSLMKSIYNAGADLARSADPAALRQRWDQQLAQIYPGDRLAEATRQVDELLRVYGGDNRLIARLREHGAIRNPTLFVNLVNRAASIARWRGTRPE